MCVYSKIKKIKKSNVCKKKAFLVIICRRVDHPHWIIIPSNRKPVLQYFIDLKIKKQKKNLFIY